MSDSESAKVNALISQQKYAEAKAILRASTAPGAASWLAKLERMDPDEPLFAAQPISDYGLTSQERSYRKGRTIYVSPDRSTGLSNFLFAVGGLGLLSAVWAFANQQHVAMGIGVLFLIAAAALWNWKIWGLGLLAIGFGYMLIRGWEVNQLNMLVPAVIGIVLTVVYFRPIIRQMRWSL